ncbi:MAG: SPOR domain-containing protein [Rhodospirillales bacterium]
MRFIPLVALAIPLSGCILPPVLVVASYAGDAVLAVTTDKTSSDHLLSMMEKRDCAMWRVIKGRPICHDWADGKDPYEKWRDADGNQVATAGSDAGFTTTMAKDSLQDVERGQSVADQQNLPQNLPENGVLLAQAGGTAPVMTAADVRRANQPDQPLSLSPFNPAGLPPTSNATSTAPVSSGTVTATPLAPPPRQPVDSAPTNDGAPITQKLPPLTVGQDGKPVIEKPVIERPVIEKQVVDKPIIDKPVVAKAPPAAKPSVSGERSRYVVIGSYRQQDNAKRVMHEHRDLKPIAQSVKVGGEHYYRVVAGPYTAARAADIRANLKAKSRIEATVRRDCDAKGNGPCIDVNG